MTSAPSVAEAGFVRMPMAWLSLPISPQAKTLLMAFCGFADADGRSYHSYRQLGDLLNRRSKGSICAYVKELVAHGLIETRKQTYGNGFNYRLLITVSGWAEQVAAWRRMSAQGARIDRDTVSRDKPLARQRKQLRSAALGPKTTSPAPGADFRAGDDTGDIPSNACLQDERRVQNDERKDPSGPITKTPQNQTLAAAPRVEWSQDDELRWRTFRPHDSDPRDSAYGQPDPDLLRKAIVLADQEKQSNELLERAPALDVARRLLAEFANEHRLQADSVRLEEAAGALAEIAPSAPAMVAAVAELKAQWQPFWRQISTPEQIRKGLRDVAEAHLPSRTDRERLGRLQMRAWVAEYHLRRLSDASLRKADALGSDQHGSKREAHPPSTFRAPVQPSALGGACNEASAFGPLAVSLSSSLRPKPLAKHAPDERRR